MRILLGGAFIVLAAACTSVQTQAVADSTSAPSDPVPEAPTSTSSRSTIFRPTAASSGMLIGLRGSESSIVVFDPDTGESMPIGMAALDAVFSPDGDRIALTSIGSEGSELTILDVETGGVQSIRPAEPSVQAQWSPDGSAVAMTAVQPLGDSGATSAVWVIDLATEVEVRISPDGLTVEGGQSWSPDGSKLVFHDQLSPTAGVVVADPDGTRRQRLEVGMFAVFPVWSPSGDRIAFHGAPESNDPGDLWTVTPDGESLERLTNVGWQIFVSVWAPTGEHLAFIAETADDAPTLYVVDAAGSELVKVAEIPGAEYPPVWSPDGGSLAYVDGDDEIVVIDRHGRSDAVSTGLIGRILDWR